MRIQNAAHREQYLYFKMAPTIPVLMIEQNKYGTGPIFSYMLNLRWCIFKQFK
jgi:hypothetical protein